MLRDYDTTGQHARAPQRFNGHPPLGVNATPKGMGSCRVRSRSRRFQWAPTLGGECYTGAIGRALALAGYGRFQWAPTLGGECYCSTRRRGTVQRPVFQWAPTLGGECYSIMCRVNVDEQGWRCFNGHPPLGVNATSA